MTTKIQTIPQVPSDFSPVHFNANSFDESIYEKGYSVILESAIPCPCKIKGSQGHLGTCKNCGGSGWFFINPIETKMLVTSINYKPVYKEWSEENSGTVMISSRQVDNISLMDRITLIDSEIIFKQTIYPFLLDEEVIVYTNYDIHEILDIFLFVNETSKLRKLSSSEYSFEGNKILFNSDLYTSKMTITVKYKCPIQYHVVDLNHEARNSYNFITGGGEQVKLPFAAVGKRSHYVLNRQNYNGDLIFDNSYQ